MFKAFDDPNADRHGGEAEWTDLLALRDALPTTSRTIIGISILTTALLTITDITNQHSLPLLQ